jgi:uncharacterized MAPEG superfamily protein
MKESLALYVPTIWALGASGALLLVQLLIADLAGVKARHRPGTPVEANHGNFLFRATRAHANTNESIAAFILLALFGMLSAASSAWLNALSWAYVLARSAHMLFYYAGFQLPRSIVFGASLLALFGMLIVGVSAWAS